MGWYEIASTHSLNTSHQRYEKATYRLMQQQQYWCWSLVTPSQNFMCAASQIFARSVKIVFVSPSNICMDSQSFSQLAKQSLNLSVSQSTNCQSVTQLNPQPDSQPISHSVNGQAQSQSQVSAAQVVVSTSRLEAQLTAASEDDDSASWQDHRLQTDSRVSVGGSINRCRGIKLKIGYVRGG